MVDHTLDRIYNHPHYVTLDKLEAIRRFVTNRAVADAYTTRPMRYMASDATRRNVKTSGYGIAVLPVLGTLAKRMDLLEESSGGTSTDRLGGEFDKLMADDNVLAIVLDVDSPGGEAYGVQELSDKIFSARGKKPIVAFANPEAGSAAYYIASAADEVSITPSGMIGSIGVVAVHTDLSKLNDTVGVKVTYISSGPYKIEGNPDQPLSEESIEWYKTQVDALHEQFIADVARNRRTTAANVRANYGQGRMLRAADAKAAGMVNRIETFDELINRLSVKLRKRASAKMDAEIQKYR